MDMNQWKRWAIEQQENNSTEIQDANRELQTQDENKTTLGEEIYKLMNENNECGLLDDRKDRTIAKPNTKAGQSLAPNSAVSTKEETEPVNEIKGLYNKVRNVAKAAINRRDAKMREGLPKDTPLVRTGQGTSQVDTPEK
tara:strand:+ start:9511 stop:9930 length:420 start_codon:yes stop_codon:yes gene_type:complete